MDISATTEPRSDQQNFDDYIAGPKTVTVSEVRKGTAEQPVEIHLVEYPGRPWKPSKSMRRVLVAAWGGEASTYVGRRITLYGDPDVKFGGKAVGGIRVSHLSDIATKLTVNLTVTRGQRAPFTVEPLPDSGISAEVVAEFEQRIADADSLDELNAIATDLKALDLGTHRAHLQGAWADRKTTLTAPAADDMDDLLDAAYEEQQ
ncbi:hypothetical protein ABQE69_09165 [Mycolicibacillus trivialis]